MAELCTAFELTDTECKIVLLRSVKQQLSLAAAVTISLVDESTPEPLNDRRKSQLIRDAIKQNKIPIHNATIVLPKHTVQVRCVTLPSDKDEEITRMARFEAGKIIPFNVENHIISHHVLRKDSIRGSRVIIAAVEDKNAESSIQILKNAGVSIENVTVSNIALYNIFRLMEPSKMAEETFALLSISHHSVDISIIDKGLLIYSRSSLSGVDRLLADLYPQDTRRGRINMDQLRRIEIEPKPGSDAASASESNAPGLGATIYQPFAANAPADTPAAPTSAASNAPLDASPGDAEQRRITLHFNGLTGAAGEPLPAPGIAQALQVEDTPAAPQAPSAAGVSISASSAEETDKIKQWLSKISQEIRRTYEFSRREFEIPAVSRLYITGEGAAIQGLEDYFGGSLGVEAVTLNPLKSEMIKGAGDVLPTPLEYFVYTIATGGALGVLWDDACHINLIPQHYVDLRLAHQKRSTLMITGGLAALALILGVLSLIQYHDVNKSQLNWYSTELRALNPVYNDVQEIAKKKKILDSYIRDKRSALGILEQISKLPYVHEKVAILEFKYIKGDTIVIQAHALTIDDINIFIGDLERMEADEVTGQRFFSTVRERQRRVTKLPRRNEQIYQFNLECDIAKAAKAPITASPARSRSAASTEEIE